MSNNSQQLPQAATTRITRIADLPETITATNAMGQQGQVAYSSMPQNTHQGIISMKDAGFGGGGGGGGGGGSNSGMSTTYIPMNMHPNPYSSSPSSANDTGLGSIDKQQQQQQQQQQPQNTNAYSTTDLHSQEKPIYKLQGHDIPRETDMHLHDQEIIANYIPPPPTSSFPSNPNSSSEKDYIAAYERDEAKKWKAHREETKYRQVSDNFIDKYQKPFFVMLLFFIFQLPVWNNLMYKYASPYLYVCNEAGDVNVYGMFLKSLVFAAALVLSEEVVQMFVI